MSNNKSIDILAADYEAQLSLLADHLKQRTSFMEGLMDMKGCSYADAHAEWRKNYEAREAVCAASRDELKRAINS